MMAVSQLSILMPLTNESANMIIMAFIIKRNKPSVTMVNGKVKKTSKGFTIALRTAKTKEKRTAVSNDAIVTPVSTLDKI